MPANNNFEERIQQQLDELRIQPPATDWQHIHAALHPGNRRRMVWWWLPLAALLISGAIYLAKEPSGVAREGRENVGKAVGNHVMGNDGKAIQEKVAGNDKPGNDGKVTQEKVVGNDKPGNNGKVEDKDITGNDYGIENENKRSRKQVIKETQPSVIDAKPNTESSIRKIWNARATFTAEQSEKTSQPFAGNHTTAIADKVLPQSSFTLNSDDAAVVPRTLTALHTTTQNQLPQPAAPWPWMNEKITTPTPRTTTTRKWQTGWWAALGSTRLSQTASLFGTQKAAADFATNNPGTVRSVSSRIEKNGQYFSAGWVLRKPMGKRWAFSTGMGVGLQSWQVSTSVFADSILPTGSLFIRSLTSTSDQQYRMLTLQVPMLLEWKLLGKQEGIWLQGGLNNQWLLQLREKQNLATVSQNFASISNTNNVASKANGWQPQLRLGLIYQWQSKKLIHQMVPAVQLPLRSAFRTDNRGLLNIQLQYNMLWLRK